MKDLPQFLYTLKPTRAGMVVDGPTEQEAQVLAQHFAHLTALADGGTVILFGRTQNNDETTFGLVIFEAASADAARDIMSGDPAVEHGLMQATLFPYKVSGMREKMVE